MEAYIGDILDGCCRDTRNDNYEGISKEDMLRYANFAQASLWAEITSKYPGIFTVTKNIQTITNEDTYTIPDNLGIGTRILDVRYLQNGDATTARKLFQTSYVRRADYVPGVPTYYQRINGKIKLLGAPNNSSSIIKVTYERGFDKLDLKRAVVESQATTTMVLTSGSYTAEDSARFVPEQVVCFTQPYTHTPVCYNAKISNWNSGTRTLAFSSLGSLTNGLVSGYTLPDLVGCYMTFGEYSSPWNLVLNEDCSAYIYEYVNRRLYKRDTRNDTNLVVEELAEIKKRIVDAYRTADHDTKTIPVVDEEIFVFDREY